MVISARHWLRNDGHKYVLLAAWLGLNGVVFWRTYSKYKSEPEFFYLREMLGKGLCISRGTADVLNLNCAFVLLPMCRTLLTSLRRSRKVARRRVRKYIDQAKQIHVVCAILVCLAAVIHTGAHIVNVVNSSQHYNKDFPEINIASCQNENPTKVLFCSVAGTTGFLMIIILCAIFTSSTRAVRTASYEVFWYIHHLFIVFYILLLFHASSGVLKMQRNVQVHIPGCLMLNKSEIMTYAENTYQMNIAPVTCESPPIFHRIHQETWMWVIFPLIFYFLERIVRFLRSRYQEATIENVIRHPCEVIEIRFTKNHFPGQPGQYIMLNIPSISTMQWHPFTLTTQPNAEVTSYSIHIRVLGDWTIQLQELFDATTETTQEIQKHEKTRKFPKMYIDGPFGSPSQDIFEFGVSVCIAGGVGVTPFAAALNKLRYNTDDTKKLRRIYFIWICRDIACFQWFSDLIVELHTKLWESNKPDFFNVELYSTQENMNEENIVPYSEYPFHRITVGRPRWKAVFKEIAKFHQRSEVGVFVCGPRSLSRSVHKRCNQRNKYNTRFVYHKESFC
ncbi:NADPH oxidase 4-like [Ptychodera flava]|uniref:NADPH oxidase 4-like n=1 Tax=Ptychodera flava TaxID=63121 RepID=UPI00396A46B7